jgi:guanylate kinase
MKREGILFIISAPSGAGKTSLCKEVIDFFPNLRHSVSFTTRQKRGGEEDGKDYFFVTESEFRRMVAAGEFAEWAEVHGNLYGTALRTLEECRAKGIDVILDIDCQGARQLKERFRGGVYIFILPPDFDELRSRLLCRNADRADVIALRIANAADEIREACRYDYIIVNDQFSKAVEELKSIMIAESCRTDRVIDSVAGKFAMY